MSRAMMSRIATMVQRMPPFMVTTSSPLTSPVCEYCHRRHGSWQPWPAPRRCRPAGDPWCRCRYTPRSCSSSCSYRPRSLPPCGDGLEFLAGAATGDGRQVSASLLRRLVLVQDAPDDRLDVLRRVLIPCHNPGGYQRDLVSARCREGGARNREARDVDDDSADQFQVAPDLAPVARQGRGAQRLDLLRCGVGGDGSGDPDAPTVLPRRNVAHGIPGVVVVGGGGGGTQAGIGVTGAEDDLADRDGTVCRVLPVEPEVGVVRDGVRRRGAGAGDCDVASVPGGEVAEH